MHRLVQSSEGRERLEFELTRRCVTIGRTSESEIVVAHPSVSRRHAQISFEGGRPFLRDLGSKNGSYCNGTAVREPRELHAGDRIKLGDVVLTFEQDSLPVGFVPTIALGKDAELTRVPIEELLRGPTPGSALKVGRSETGHNRAQDKLQMLLQVAELLSSPEPIDLLLPRILDLLFRILDCDRGAILLVDEATGQLVPRVVKSSKPAASNQPIYSQHIVDYVRSKSIAAIFSDASADPRLGKAESVVAQSIRASMCAPLRPRDEVIGVLYVDNLSVPNRFSKEDLDFLAAFASQAGIAIENARLYRRIEEEAVLRNTLFRFFPPATIKRLMHGPGSSLGTVETEVTALFADISSFTAMSSSMEPREVVELLNEYFPVMADIVFRHEGTLEKYIGDALMAIWGAPFPHDDDVDRAVIAAITMHHALGDLNRRWATRHGRELQIHIGLNTGKVAAGNIGSERYVQYAAIGDATNVAARTCSVAAPGELVISRSTYDKLRDRTIPVEALPPVMVKGKDEPLELLRVLWRLVKPSRPVPESATPDPRG